MLIQKKDTNTGRIGQGMLDGWAARLLEARYAIVSAVPDGRYGIESIKVIAAFLREDAPDSIEDAALMRQRVWADNAVEIGN